MAEMEMEIARHEAEQRKSAVDPEVKARQDALIHELQTCDQTLGQSVPKSHDALLVDIDSKFASETGKCEARLTELHK